MRALASLLTLLLGAAGAAQARPQIEHWTAASGARVYFVESRALPMVDVAVEFSAGGAYDPREQAGLAMLTQTLFKAGTMRSDEAEVSRRLADVGAQLGDTFDRDRAGFTLRSLSSPGERAQALETLAEMLQTPRFPEDAFQREKARSIANAREAETRPDRVAERRLYALMYPAHPYGLSATPSSLATITGKEVERFYRQHYQAGSAVVTIVGDLDRGTARAIADALTARLPAAEPPPAVLDPVVKPSGESLNIAHPSAQSHVLLGLPALARGDPDYFPLFVGNYVLGGGGFVSRLFREVREKRGYAYSAYSYFLPLLREGPFLLGLQTKKDQAGEALTRARAVLDEFLAQGPTQAELAAAKRGLIGGFPLRIDTNRKMLEQVAVIGYYRLPLTWLDDFAASVGNVTLEQIRAAFARRVDPARLATVVVGAP